MSAPRCPECGMRTGRPLDHVMPSVDYETETVKLYIERGWECWRDSCRHRWGFTDTFHPARFEGAVCDFCHSRDPILGFESEDFYIGEDHYSADWAACKTCAELILRRERTALAQRSVETLIVNLGRVTLRDRTDITAAIQKIHDGFWAGFHPTAAAPEQQEQVHD